MELYDYINADCGVKICCAEVFGLSVDDDEISAYRKNRLAVIKTEAARRLSLGAEAVLIANMKKNVPDAVFPLSYGADEKGKPKFTDDCGVHFSLSHSGSIAACAIANVPVGIDVQAIKAPNMKLAARYFTANELGENDGSYGWFMRIWARKEAVAKAEGTGISVGLSDIDVSGDEVMLNGDRYYVQDIAIQHENYCMAVAVRISD